MPAPEPCDAGVMLQTRRFGAAEVGAGFDRIFVPPPPPTEQSVLLEARMAMMERRMEKLEAENARLSGRHIKSDDFVWDTRMTR